MTKRFGPSALIHVAILALAFTGGCHTSMKAGGENVGPIVGRPAGQTVGQTCALEVAAGPSQGVYNTAATQCLTGLCLKPVLDPNKTELTPPTGPTCSRECSSDSDCDGELRDTTNSNDRRCRSGFTCAVPFSVGPLCCKHLCVCKDFLSTAEAATPPACTSGTCDKGPSDGPVGQETDIYISVAPIRKLDLVFMIDNSPSMAPKVAKLNAQFPKLIASLKDPTAGTLPDLRLAILDSDLGTGGAYPNGSCGPNDSNGQNAYGDFGNFQMRKGTDCGMSSADALWIEYTKGVPVNYSPSRDISSVFSCLATNLGTIGCGEEHQLQAFEFGLIAQNLHKDQNGGKQNTFLRPEAYLGLVFLSDEDDCSAATNDGMFGDKPQLRSESASLRCATRGHLCYGQKLADVTPPGYPTNASFAADFTSCAARMDACPNSTDGDQPTDTSGPTACSPLKSIRKLANELKALKGDLSADKLLVAGIFGWPRMDSDGKTDFSKAEKYKIDLVPNPNSADTAHPQVYDYWPVCYEPNHLPRGSGFDADAWGWGAQGGLRLSAFIDEFGSNGLKYSICESDFTGAMKGIGDALAKKLQNLCVSAKLVDVDPATPGLQPTCRVTYRVPSVDSKTNKITYQESGSLPLCPPDATPDTIAADCWQLANDPAKCPGSGQRVTVVRTAAAVSQGPIADGTKIAMQCLSCPDAMSAIGCDY